MQYELPIRKHPRLKDYDHSQESAYFITMCVKDKHEWLGAVVGRGILDAPIVELSEYGEILEKTIEFVNNEKNEIDITQYAIMPNHVHMIVVIRDLQRGASGKPRPTCFIHETIYEQTNRLSYMANILSVVKNLW